MSPPLRFVLHSAALCMSAALLLVAAFLAWDAATASPCRDSFHGAFLVLAAPSIYFQLLLSSWLCYVILAWSRVKAGFLAAITLQVLLVFGTVTYYSWPALSRPPIACE